MKSEKIEKIQKLLNRQLRDSEIERLNRIQEVIEISDNDALWDIIIALEYHRAYYEELPQKIASLAGQIKFDDSSRKMAHASSWFRTGHFLVLGTVFVV